MKIANINKNDPRSVAYFIRSAYANGTSREDLVLLLRKLEVPYSVMLKAIEMELSWDMVWRIAERGN